MFFLAFILIIVLKKENVIDPIKLSFGDFPSIEIIMEMIKGSVGYICFVTYMCG